MSLAADLIRARIADSVAPDDIDLVSGLIQDSLAPGAGLAAIEDAVAKARSAFGVLFTTAPATPPAEESVTEKVRREAKATPPTSTATGVLNPWAKGTVNLTQQVLIASRDPNRAARLKALANG